MDRQLYHYVHHPESPLLESKNRLQPTPTTYQPSEIGQAEIPLGKGGGPNLYGMVGNDLISSVDKLGKIKWKEIKYCGLTLSIKRACCCLRAKSIADRVNELMQKRYGGQIDDGQTNALKHCIWNCKMARSFCGKKRAKKISSAHEDFEDNDANRKKMDLHNNQIGINLSGKDGNCVDLCETALKER
ncbi:MAG: hypothetical protein ACJA16_004101, partial [Akkermansiaceae bacterium]